MPLTVPCTRQTPALTDVRVFATANPQSLWQCIPKVVDDPHPPPSPSPPNRDIV
jgi:hypothetical protein